MSSQESQLKSLVSNGKNDTVRKDSSVEIRPSRIQDGGKGLFIKHDIDEGEEIWAQKRALVAALDPESLSIVCSHCFAQVNNVTRGWIENEKPLEVKSCTGCNILRFCGKQCQVAAWKWHKYTCKYWSKTNTREDKAMIQTPLYRMLVQLLSMRKAKLISEQQWTDILEMEGIFGSSSNESSVVDQKTAFLAVDTINGSNADMKSAKRLLHILKCNTFTLVANTFDPLGAAFDPVVCRMNHSCAPNCHVAFDGARISIRSLSKLNAKDEMTISYIDPTYPRQLRQQELKERYHFTCSCPVCNLGTKSWQDDFPLLSNMPPAFRKTLAEPKIPAKAALESKAMRLLAGFANLDSATVKDRIEYLEGVETFFKASRCWPLYRQGRAEMLDNLLLLYIGAQRYADATKLAAALYLLVVPVHYPQAHHPLATTHCLRLIQLLTNIGFESGHALPFDVMLVLWELARRVVEGSKKSHGESSKLYHAICERFALEVLNMAKSMTGMSRKDVQIKVNEELEKMKVWAAGSDQVLLYDKSIVATHSSK